MSILISKDKCVGCKKCVDVCPGSLIKSDENGLAFIKYPEYCWGCSSCLKECNSEAISMYLGADIGGRGALLTIRNNGDILNWVIKKTDGSIEEVEVNKKESNKY